MSIKLIGETINALRKEKGISQEELGKAVGVSTQAVSKWECGGVPDVELLPVIADYFQVSIDKLFGRSVSDYNDIDTATANYIASLDIKDRMSKSFEHCWTLERSICGINNTDEHNSLNEIRSKDKNMVYSQMLYDSGITLMCLNESLPYFLLIPEPGTGWNNALKNIDFTALFKMLSEKDVFDTLFLLYQRDNNPFTPKLLNKKLNIPIERAEEILDLLKRYSLISISEVELDDEVQKVYNFTPNPAFIALLVFAREMIDKPGYFYSGCFSREKPYL